MNLTESTTPREVSPAAQQRVDEFSRELALVLRRITGRRIEPELDERLPSPVPKPSSTSQEPANDPG